MRIPSPTAIRVLFLLAGVAGLTACNEAPRPAARPKAMPVSVTSPGYAAVPSEMEVPGTVQSRDRVQLSSQINGFVREMRVREGDEVRRGQVLVTLDAREPESQKAAAEAVLQEAGASLAESRQGLEASEKMLAAARASAGLAETTLARYQKLSDARSVSSQELDEVRARRDAALADVSAREAMAAAAKDRIRQVEARITQAEAQVRRAEVVLGWAVVTAPAGGRVAQRTADPGSAIFPGSPLLALETTGDLQVLASIPATRAGILHPGLEVTVSGGSDPSMRIRGKISEIIPASSSSTHSQSFRVDLPSGTHLPPGLFVKVYIAAGTRQALLVPREALRQTGQITGVLVVDGSSQARLRLVRTAPYDDNLVELLSGLEPGERIVVNPAPDVVDGTPVEVRP